MGRSQLRPIAVRMASSHRRPPPVSPSSADGLDSCTTVARLASTRCEPAPTCRWNLRTDAATEGRSDVTSPCACGCGGRGLARGRQKMALERGTTLKP
jgi:hypothetical protein